MSILFTSIFLHVSSLDPTDYEKAWNGVQQAIDEGLPKEAEELAFIIYQQAKSEHNDIQTTKAVVFLAGFALQLNDDGVQKAQHLFENEIAISKSPFRNILQSYYGEFLSNFFQNNRYAINQRTETSVDNELNTITASQLVNRIANQYIQSLSDHQKLDVNIDEFKPLLNDYNEKGKFTHPLLYEVLADRALNYFGNNVGLMQEVASRFLIDNVDFFKPAELFSKTNFVTSDSSSSQYQLTQIYQDIFRHSYASKNLVTLAHFDLLRLNYMYANTTLKNKELIYEQALQTALTTYAAYEISTDFKATLANHYLNSNTKDRYTKAKAICESAITTFPASEGSNLCKMIINQVLQKELAIQIEVALPVSSPFAYNIKCRNVDQVNFRLVKTPSYFLDALSDGTQDLMGKLKNEPVINQWQHNIAHDEYYLSKDTVFSHLGLSGGNYLLLVSDKIDFSGAFQYSQFQVTNLSYITYMNRNERNLVVAHRKSGMPISGVDIEFYENSYNSNNRKYEFTKVGTTKTDKDGKAKTPESNQALKLILRDKEDVFDGANMHYSGYYQEPQAYTSIELFTDRQIYRPGQVVYFKALALNYLPGKYPQIEKGKAINVQLNDVNGQKVAALDLLTNEFGSCSGSFTLPSRKLTGYYYIQTNNGGKPIRVEEYKRPGFEIVFDTITEAYKLGDKIKISGSAKAFAGNNINNATLKYKVVRRSVFPFCYRFYYPGFQMPELLITTGNAMTDDLGKFIVNFDAIFENVDGPKPIYNYVVFAEVTDQNGETQSAEFVVNLSNYSRFVEHNLPATFDKVDSKNYKIDIKNLDGIVTKNMGILHIYKLKEEESIKEPFLWDEHFNQNRRKEYSTLAIEKEYKPMTFASGEKIDVSFLPAGIYKIKVNEATGLSDTLTDYFVMSDFNKKKLPLSQHVLVRSNKTTLAPNDKMIVDFGSPSGKISVYAILTRGNEIIKQSWLKLSKATSFTYLISEADKGGLQLQYFYVANNQFHTETIQYEVPWTEKELKITYETFKDKLTPGQKTEFRVKISGSKKEKIQAEVLAAMYDASLDQFGANSWNTKFNFNNYGYIGIEGIGFGLVYSNELNYYWQQSTPVDETNPSIIPSLITPPFFNSYGYAYGGMPGIVMVQRSASMAESAMDDSVAGAPRAKNSAADSKGGDSREEVSAMKNEVTQKPIITPRTNLNETVFFFPHLLTDENGDLILSFTMNEAMTKWRLMTFAHTNQLASAYDSRMVQTTKDLMIVANSPRFIREGDVLWFTARVSNLSDHDIAAVAYISLADALSQKSQDDMITSAPSVQLQLKKGESKAVAWKLSVPLSSTDLLKYTVSASSGEYTDGESSVLPVLSNKVLMTESLPIFVRGKQSKSYSFSILENRNSNSHTAHSYTVEMSSHPIWYAVQALPYIIEQNSECATQLASRFFVNSISKNIIDKYPMIESVFNLWRTSDKEALLSNLAKNENLKNALLDESPWVMDAINESKQKSNIARLFDSNTVNADLHQNLSALQALQLGDGSFSWFPGGRADLYSTKYVAEIIGRSRKLNVSGENTDFIYSSLTFLDSQFKKQLMVLTELLKKSNQKPEDYQPTNDEIYHLFVRSFYPQFPVGEGAESSYSFYYTQALKFANKYDIFTQSLLGMTDYRMKGKKWPDLAKSIMQKSFTSEENGIYWNAGNGYHWYEMPVERHASIMEFLHETSFDIEKLDEMKVWLLKNKQSNNWKTTKASTSAIIALLLHHGPRQANLIDAEAVHVTAGKTYLPLNKSMQAGTSYYKHQWASSEIDPSLGKLLVENPNPNIAWGAAYYQYFEEIGKIKTSTSVSPLTIEKTIFKEVMTPTGKKLEALTDKGSLHPGDVIVSRIIIHADRDMDYIHLKDLRASGMEPYTQANSGYRWSSGFGYYESVRDLATHYFIDHLPKGVHVFESRQRVVHKGKYSGALASIQCFYAPEFASNSEGAVLNVD